MRRILILANQTLGGDHLADVIRARMAERPTSFYLLVPATHRTDVVTALAEAFAIQGGIRPPAPSPDADADAGRRLAAGLAWIRGLGATVDGQVGHHDPLRAVRDHLAAHECDEIVISTLPHGISSWLQHDLRQRIERGTGLPTDVVTAAYPVATGTTAPTE